MKSPKRITLGSLVILIFSLSAYFNGIAAATPLGANGPPLTLYQLDQSGRILLSSMGMFVSGQKIGIGIPAGRFGPYTLTATNTTDATVAVDHGDSLPSDNVLVYSLSPARFAPYHEYQLQLNATVETSPGFIVHQISTAVLTVVPGAAHEDLRNYQQQAGSSRADVSLLDADRNPSTGVRLGLVLHYDNSTIQLVTETTDLQGQATFQVGESLGGGNYYLTIEDLDQNAVSASALQLPGFRVDAKPTILQTTTIKGLVQAVLLADNGQRPVVGRLLILEKQLADGNWTIVSSGYTDSGGRAQFPSLPSANVRLSFHGDEFYGTSTVSISNSLTENPTSSTVAKQSPREPSPATLPATGTSAATGGATSPTIPASTSTSQPTASQFFVAPALGCTCACPTGPVTPTGVSPNCGGGGGGGGTLPPTTTTLQFQTLPYYATIPSTISAVVKDSNGNPLAGLSVNFYYDGAYLISTGVTDSTGTATVAWTPGIYGSHLITASFPGNGSYGSSQSAQYTTINQDPTTVQILEPNEIAYAWDLYFTENGYGLPIVVPVNILALAASGTGAPSGIYMPATSGVSTTPANIPGFGWAGLNVYSIVTLTFNGTFTETQNMTWTRNFYLPVCPNLPPCSLSPRTGHMNLTATLSPPSTLYTGSTTKLNVPYQNVNSVKTSSSQVTQNATPPKHVYVNVNATYPYLSDTMGSIPVSLISYYSWLAYLQQQSPTFSVQGTQNVYALPIINSTAGSDFATACSNTGCTIVPTNTTMYLYNSQGAFCVTTRTDFFGVAPLDINSGISGCNYPYSYLGTGSTSITVSALYAIEAVGNPQPFYTNFQGYNYAVYAPHRTGGYLLHMFPTYLNAPFTVLYPSTSYSDVAYPWYTCCDVFYTVEKHPVNATVTITPGTRPKVATINDNIQATVHLADFARQKPFGNLQVSYSLTRTDPSPGSIASGTFTTDVNGSAIISIGQLSYGAYTITITWPGNSTTTSINTSASFTVYKAKPTLLLRSVQEPVIPYISLSGIGPVTSPAMDGSTQGYCSHTTNSCTASLSTTHGDDIIIVFTMELLNLSPNLCTFGVKDNANLHWVARTPSVNGYWNGNQYRDQIQEWWALSRGTLSSDVITESISNCATADYGGEYNGLIAFGIAGANPDSPFDPNSGVPSYASGYSSSASVQVSTSVPNDVVFAAVVGGNGVPTVQSGFNAIQTSGFPSASEYAIESNTLSGSSVGFGSTANSYWQMVADAVQPAFTPSVLPNTGSPYRIYTYVGDDRSLQSGPWSCSWPTYTNCVILQLFIGLTPSIAVRVAVYYWSGGNVGSFNGNGNSCAIASCSPTWSTAPSSFCNGALYCYYFGLDICCLSSYANEFVHFTVNAFDVAGQSPVFGSYSNGWGFIDNPNGAFLINGAKVRPSDLVGATSNTESFQFNATQSPNSITSVSIQITNMTTGSSKTVCVIGSSCLQPAQTTSGSFLLYPATNLVFTTGAYNITAYFACSNCPNLMYRTMYVMLEFGGIGEIESTGSPWIQGATAQNPYYFRTYLVDNSSQTLINAGGLTETVYINDTLYGTYTTGAGGTAAFPWTPPISALYRIRVFFSSQSYYTGANATAQVSVQLRGVTLAVAESPVNPEVGSTISWQVMAEDMVTQATLSGIVVNLNLDGSVVRTSTTDSTGTASFSYPIGTQGKHTVIFVSQATQVYNTAKSYNSLTVYLSTKMTMNSGTVTIGLPNPLTVTLTDINGVALPSPGRTVTIHVNGAFYQNVTTDASGNAQFSWRPDNLGTYTITADFYAESSSDVGYRASSARISVTVIPQTTTNSQTTQNGTQSVSFPSGTGNPTSTAGLSASITFPSLGWVDVNIQFLGRSFQGTLHVWNDIGVNCTTWLWGACVFALPYWRVHFDVTTNIQSAAFSIVTDFFTGVFQTVTATFAGVKVPFDFNSAAFTWGQNGANGAFLAAVAVYGYVLFQSGSLGEPAAAPASIATLLLFTLVTGIIGLAVYQDKTNRLNFLAGELAAVGLGVFGNFAKAPYNPCDWPCIPLVDSGWDTWWGIYTFGSTPWGKVVLLTGMLTMALGLLTALLMIWVT